MGKLQELKDKIEHTEKMIKFYEGQKVALLLELILSCHHMEVISTIDGIHVKVKCNDCDSILFDGDIYQYKNWRSEYKNGELMEVNISAK